MGEKKEEVFCDGCKESGSKKVNAACVTTELGRHYCNLHAEKWKWLDEVKARNKKPCRQHIRGCRAELDVTDKNINCEACKEKMREKEKKRTERRAIARKTADCCPRCNKKYDDPNEFIGPNGQPVEKCRSCRERCRTYDRSARTNGIKKSYPMSEATKEKKELWKKEHYDKIVGYWIKHRSKNIIVKDENYWKLNAEHAKMKRDMLTDEERIFVNETKRKDIGYKLDYYKYRSKKCKIEWELTDEESCDMFMQNCYYCNCEADEYHNGIDRIDNEIGYTSANCVSACRMCNVIKGCLEWDVFLKRCEHILTYLKIIDGHMYDNIYPVSISQNYEGYQIGAQHRNINFELTEQDYCNIVSGRCYLCGTESHNNHINGIDRFDSKRDYKVDNCKTCCTECNYMKNKYDYDTYVKKLLEIYNNHKNDLSKMIQINERNSINIDCNEVNLYTLCASENKFIRSNFYFPKIKMGKWKYSTNSNNGTIIKMETQYDNNDVEMEQVIIDNMFHKLPFIMLTQSHNKRVTHKIDLSDKMTEIFRTHDSQLFIKIPSNHKNVTITTLTQNDEIVSIKFSVDETIQGYCKCTHCKNHGVCYCSNCVDHCLHGDVLKCYWCSKNYTGNKYKEHTLMIHGSKEIIGKYTAIAIKPTRDSINDTFTRKLKVAIIKNKKEYSKKEENGDYNYMRVHKNRGRKPKVTKTRSQKAEEARIRKQRSRQNMKDKYGDEQWRKIHAEEVHLNRLKKNEECEEMINKVKNEIEELKKINDV
jgi:hypothetical protein